jgi:predicted DNA-binding antitoxin AbrB/MazE fold protein
MRSARSTPGGEAISQQHEGDFGMDRIVDAIYEQGTLKLLEALDLPEYQWVRITIHEVPTESPDEMLDAWHQVYEGLTDEEIRQIEALALDRRYFMRQEP